MGSLLAKFRQEEFRILMQGLDAAGKTTILYRLKLGEVVTTIPTIGVNVETVEHRHIKFTAWDVGGRGKMRALRRHYYQNTSAILYVVDSNDEERMAEVREIIHENIQEDELRGIPLLFFANKQDLPGALTIEKTCHLLELHKIKDRPWHIVPSVATTGDGLHEGLDWLSATLSRRTKPTPTKTTATTTHPSIDTVFGKSWELFKSVFVA